MNLVSILEDKAQKIIAGTEAVSISGEEMNVLCDPEQLRALKIYQDLPYGYHHATSAEECLELIRQGDSIYRTLEYCVLSNRALQIIRNYIWFDRDGVIC